jgi:tetrapyrrole methylase family protein/MazG family protein
MSKVVVVGLGPAGADLLLPAARAALTRTPVRFARTARHPAVDELEPYGMTFTAFDDVYERASEPESVYREIVDTLVTAAREHGAVAYAVPGSPVVAERTVVLLGERARAGDVELEIVPGLSFADLAWARLGVDPLSGARVLDGRALDPAALEAGGPVLFAQLDTALVLSDVKLALLDRVAPDHEAVVLHHLGRPDEQVVHVALADADRVLAPDHLTALFVDLPPGAADAFGALLALGRRLRGPGGCPWDAEQTHHSLTRYLLEEAYEVVDAIEALPADAPTGADTVDDVVDDATWAALADELGDLLFQVVFHAVLAQEADAFTATDVAQGIHDKLVRRHPHVFGDVDVTTAGDVVRNWEQIKKGERGSDSLVDSVPAGLPALLYTHKLFRKAASIGLDPSDRADAIASVERGLDALRAPGGAPIDTEAAVGDVLAGAVGLARAGGVDAESALRGWAARYRDHFQRMEALARDRGLDLGALAPDAVDALWAETASATR